jgi:hypothetical protein
MPTTSSAAPLNADAFALSLLEESKRFLEKARTSDDTGKRAFLHAALLLAFCSLEAHVNAMSDDFSAEMKLSPHEKGILTEREVHLENGAFRIRSTPKMVRLEDRIKFICKRFARTPIDFTAPWWSKLADATKLRNALTHPKENVPLEVAQVQSAIQAIIETLDALYAGILGNPFPAAGLQLDSELNF